MNSYHLCIATAKLNFSSIYWFEHRCCYAFDITFEEPSTLFLSNLAFIPAGHCKDEAEDFLKAVKKQFETAGIVEGMSVSVLFSDNQILAISAIGSDKWIDVRKGILPYTYPKSFSVLEINIKSLEVY